MSDLFDYGDPYIEWEEANAANEDGESVVRGEQEADASSPDDFQLVSDALDSLLHCLMQQGIQLATGAPLVVEHMDANHPRTVLRYKQQSWDLTLPPNKYRITLEQIPGDHDDCPDCRRV